MNGKRYRSRVTDAYYSRSQRGFKMGGKPLTASIRSLSRWTVSTIKKLVVNPEEAANIRLMFEMYAQPTTSYGEALPGTLAEQGILSMAKEPIRHAGADVTQSCLCAGRP